MNDFSSKKRRAVKGAAIRQAGLLTGIHALPEHIKSRLDELLLSRYSPEKVLSQLTLEFPNVNLPSKSAVYSYKDKYLPVSLTGTRQVSQAVEQLDIEKMDTAKLFLSHIKRFVAIDLNVMQERWYKAVENDQKQGKNQKTTDDAGKMYMEGMKMATIMLNQFNVKMPLEEEQKDNFAKTISIREIVERYAPEVSILARMEDALNKNNSNNQKHD